MKLICTPYSTLVLLAFVQRAFSRPQLASELPVPSLFKPRVHLALVETSACPCATQSRACTDDALSQLMSYICLKGCPARLTTHEEKTRVCKIREDTHARYPRQSHQVNHTYVKSGMLRKEYLQKVVQYIQRNCSIYSSPEFFLTFTEIRGIVRNFIYLFKFMLINFF